MGRPDGLMASFTDFPAVKPKLFYPSPFCILKPSEKFCRCDFLQLSLRSVAALHN
jgi:hypothetical protein